MDEMSIIRRVRKEMLADKDDDEEKKTHIQRIHCIPDATTFVVRMRRHSNSVVIVY